MVPLLRRTISMLQLLESIANTTKRKEKESLLANAPNGSLLQKIAILAYDPTYDYYIKDFDMPSSYSGIQTLEWGLNCIKNEFNGGKIRGNAAKERLNEILSSLTEDDAIVLSRVVKRDLRCGISSSTINKVWEKLVYDHPYSRCNSYNEKNISKISFPCLSQTKMDGLYIDIMVYDDKVEYRSRQGNILPFNQHHIDTLLIEHAAGNVIQGEALVASEDGGYASRQEGNGSLNRDNVDVESLRYVVWNVVKLDDFLKRKSDEVYSTSFQRLVDILNDISIETDIFSKVNTEICETKEDIIAFFKQQVEDGHEGAVIKNLSYKWKNGISNDQVKMKIIIDCDFKVTGWEYGDKGTKFEHMLGKLQVESSDGLIKFNVGTGFKEKEREDFLKMVDDWVSSGKIVKLKGNGLTTNKLNPDFYALYLGRFIEVRDDKTEADSYDRVVEIIDSYTQTLQYIV